MSQAIVKEYTTKIDAEQRAVIHDAEYEYYNVKHFKGGAVLLTPRILVEPDSIDKATLQMIDQAIENFEKGVVSEPVDLDEAIKIADEL